jgi:hypothetical protein
MQCGCLNTLTQVKSLHFCDPFTGVFSFWFHETEVCPAFIIDQSHLRWQGCYFPNMNVSGRVRTRSTIHIYIPIRSCFAVRFVLFSSHYQAHEGNWKGRGFGSCCMRSLVSWTSCFLECLGFFRSSQPATPWRSRDPPPQRIAETSGLDFLVCSLFWISAQSIRRRGIRREDEGVSFAPKNRFLCLNVRMWVVSLSSCLCTK